MSWIAGIDYSTKAIDVVLVDENGDEPPVWHRFDLVGEDAFDRTRSVHRCPYGQTFYIDWMNVFAVGIEDPRGHGAGALYRVQGAILGRLPTDLLVHPLIPSQWRKLVELPGNASKGHVKAHVIGDLVRRFSTSKTIDRNGVSFDYSEYPPWINDWPQDACDAYCIAQATRILIERGKVAA